MRRKLDLALSLMAEPPILFLDEPTSGLDPTSRHALWEIIRGLVGRGTTVLLTTQYLGEADALAGSVVFIDAGRIVTAGTPAELKARAGQAQFDLIAASDADVIRLAAALGALAVVTDQARRAVRVAVQSSGLEGVRELNAITGAAVRAGASIERFSLSEPDPDDVYFQLTGHARAAGAAGDTATSSCPGSSSWWRPSPRSPRRSASQPTWAKASSTGSAPCPWPSPLSSPVTSSPISLAALSASP